MYTAERLYKIGDTFVTPGIMALERDFLDSWLPRHSYEGDLVLHHYTDARGMIGIVQSKALWATEVDYLNDSKELEYGLSRVRAEIDRLQDEYESVPLVRDNLLDSLQTHLSNFHQGLYRIFVSCFCEEGDLLSQWRGYAGRGGGYALGIEFGDDTKIQSTGGHEYNPMLRKIIYNPEEQRQYIRDYLGKVCESISSEERAFQDDFQNEAAWSSLASWLTNILMDLAVSFKHPGFSEENEWRLIRFLRAWDEAPQSTDFREVDGLAVPYVPTQIWSPDETNDSASSAEIFPLRSVKYGPTLPDDRAELSIRSLLKTAGAKEDIEIDAQQVEVEAATIPFRG